MNLQMRAAYKDLYVYYNGRILNIEGRRFIQRYDDKNRLLNDYYMKNEWKI